MGQLTQLSEYNRDTVVLPVSCLVSEAAAVLLLTLQESTGCQAGKQHYMARILPTCPIC